jgi:hypothetical protein
MSTLDLDILHELQTMLSEVNPYAQTFRSIRNLVSNNPTQALHLRILAKRSKDARTYNIPIGNEVVAIMVGDGSEDVDHRDVVVQDRQGGLQRISELHPTYMPMLYVFMFPYGEDGWHPSILVCHVVIQNQRMVKSLQMNLMETMIQKVANQIQQEENVVAER